jgi:hypothetical protein
VKRRTNILAVLRRQRDRLGRLLAVGFAVASFASAGAPCLAMASSSHGSSNHAAAQPIAHHEHGAQAHSADHGHGGIIVQTAAPEPQRAVHCPHCPLPDAIPGHVSPADGHSFCSAYDDVADQTSGGSPPSFVKHVLLIAAFEIPPPLGLHPPRSRTTRELARARTSIALNLRHCVFLI